ncbi:hypothetical protein FNV43_RR00077 [Rhamnella rubrinervis]|uniref:YqaJ viral recombinase domain-containing protein n=1 Tax=Rhamnella rubrinervis TaxID=2594499 RepID=A0A8K0MS22_9ROSA|nr:hypothetical protein FNV43_RR00077 [Rhamnella rubrinervis]
MSKSQPFLWSRLILRQALKKHAKPTLFLCRNISTFQHFPTTQPEGRQREREQRRRAGLDTKDIDQEDEEDYLGVVPLVKNLERLSMYEEPTDCDSHEDDEKRFGAFQREAMRHQELLKNFAQSETLDDAFKWRNKIDKFEQKHFHLGPEYRVIGELMNRLKVAAGKDKFILQQKLSRAMRLVEWKEACDPNNPANYGVSHQEQVGPSVDLLEHAEFEKEVIIQGVDDDGELQLDDMLLEKLNAIDKKLEQKLAELDHTFGNKGKVLEEEIRDLAEERNSLKMKKRRPLYRKVGKVVKNTATLACGNYHRVVGYAKAKGPAAPVALQKYWNDGADLLIDCNQAYEKCFQNLHYVERREEHTMAHALQTAYKKTKVSKPGASSMKFTTGETYPILRSSGLQHWFKNWQELRQHILTASTFPAAIGFWRHRRVQLWLEKIGAIKAFSGNLATCWSNIKEEEALERYKLITGNTVLFPEFQVYANNTNENHEKNWLGASPDGIVDKLVYGLPSRGVLEIKCPFFDGDMASIALAQGLMEIMDRDWMDFYVWTPKGSSLFRVYRDPEYWNLLKTALSDFWWKHVQPAKELCGKSLIMDPLAEFKLKDTKLSLLKPAPRHELCGEIVYNSRRIVVDSKLLRNEARTFIMDCGGRTVRDMSMLYLVLFKKLSSNALVLPLLLLQQNKTQLSMEEITHCSVSDSSANTFHSKNAESSPHGESSDTHDKAGDEIPDPGDRKSLGCELVSGFSESGGTNEGFPRNCEVGFVSDVGSAKTQMENSENNEKESSLISDLVEKEEKDPVKCEVGLTGIQEFEEFNTGVSEKLPVKVENSANQAGSEEFWLDLRLV